jgi:hypothetical protein
MLGVAGILLVSVVPGWAKSQRSGSVFIGHQIIVPEAIATVALNSHRFIVEKATHDECEILQDFVSPFRGRSWVDGIGFRGAGENSTEVSSCEFCLTAALASIGINSFNKILHRPIWFGPTWVHGCVFFRDTACIERWLFSDVSVIENEGCFLAGNYVANFHNPRRDPSPVFVPHFGQLIVENPALPTKDRYGENTDDNQSTRPSSNYSCPTCYFIGGVILVLIGSVFAGYGATYGSNKKYQARQYIVETLVCFGLIGLSVLIVTQGIYLIYLATTDRRSENVGVETIVIPELKFRDVQRKVLFADLVEGADHAALNQRPKAFDGVCVDCADNVIALSVIDGDVLRKFLIQMLVANPLIGHEQADFVRDGFMHKAFQRDGAHVFNDAGNHVALAANSTSDHGFARSGPASAVTTASVMSVFGFPANESLVNLDNAAKLFNVAFRERSANAMAHVPSGFVRAEAHETIDLQCAHSLFAGQHQVNDAEPIFERLIRVLKNRAGKVGEAIGRVRGALVALPMPRITLQLSRFYSATARAMDALWPPLAD